MIKKMILVGAGWAIINVNAYPMVVDMGNGTTIGKYTGMYYTCSMAAQIATPILSGFLIENTALGYRLLFPYAALYSGLTFISMLCVKHGEITSEIKRDTLGNQFL